MMVVCALLALLTAGIPHESANLRPFLVPAIAAVFFAAFVLVELIPGLKREPTLPRPRSLFPPLAALVIVTIVYLFGRSHLQGMWNDVDNSATLASDGSL
ncbi:MAG: hypothetical protein ACRD4S_08775 [Candidatus Acidiferrales bacterium]